MTPNETQRANLRKLADHLATQADPNRFDMTSYRTVINSTNWLRPYEPEPECGTICCAAGHGPQIGLPAEPDEYWDDYTRRVFGADRWESYGLWDWLFSADWYYIDNTPAGAAKRIYHYLEHGVPDPDSVDDQMHDIDDYIFAEA